jgi:predicted DNA binding CopG/RHH family protein
VKINFKKLRLMKDEREIEKAIKRDEFVDVSPEKFKEIADAIARSISRRKKEAMLSIRINQGDLDNLKKKAKHYGVPYQTFISEILHHHAA